MFEFLSILLVGVAGGLIPLFFKWGDRQHHIALAFSAGIFLGAVFLHLLPGVAAAASVSHAGHIHGAIGPWLWVLIGLLSVFLIEAVFIPGSTHGHGHEHNDKERHSAVGWAALIGLTVHALTAGVALAAVQSQADIAGVMLLAILAHKGFESFSLAAVFSMTGARRGRVLAMVIAFSFVTPLGLLAGSRISDILGPDGISVLISLAAGTFLYVCLCELLPEVFHHREDGPWKIAVLLLGITCMWYAHTYGGI